MKVQVERPMPLARSGVWFGLPALTFYFLTHWGIPRLAVLTGWPPILCWFLLGGLGMFIPLFLVAWLAAGRANPLFDKPSPFTRLRLQPMRGADWQWAFTGLFAILFATWILQWLMKTAGLISTEQLQPPFLPFAGFEPHQRWMLLLWLPFFFFNIAGEELLWRGYILPLQELQHGSKAWVVNALLWTVFHFCFGWRLMLILLPILFILPYIVQKRQNTWIGIFIHAAVNGPAFLLLALRLL